MLLLSCRGPVPRGVWCEAGRAWARVQGVVGSRVRSRVKPTRSSGSAAGVSTGVSGAAGYCAAGVIADDLMVDRWWPEMTLAYASELAGL